MDKSRLEWKVGLFVLVGLVLLAVLLLQFSKGASFFRSTYRILLTSENISGLKVRAQVLMSGVQVGAVSDLALGPQGTNVTITLVIYSQYKIYTNSQFVIETSGFLGDQYVAILPTKNEGDTFADGGVARAEAPFDIQAAARTAGVLLKHVDETATRLSEVIAEVRRLALNERTLTNLSVSVGNFRLLSEHALTTVDNINQLVETNRPSIAVSISNLVFFSEQLNQVADGFTRLVATNSPEVDVAVKNVESSTAMLKNLLEDVQAGKGLAGELLKNEEIAANVSQIASNLSITTSNLNRLGLWGVLWKHKPPRTNAPAEASAPLTAPKHPLN